MRFADRMRVVAVLATTLSLALAAGGCGDEDAGGRDGAMREATLVLDFQANAVHAGIFRALAAGYYEDRGLDLRVVTPTSTADTLKLIDAGRAAFGLADAVDVAGQIEAGRGAKAIMAVVQRPLGGVITLAEEDIESPAQLEGHTVGVTGVPSDDAILDTVVSAMGGDPSEVERVTIGFNGVQALVAGKIAAFTGYAAADATQIEVQDRRRTRVFALDDHGGPVYPGLVAFSTQERIAEQPELMEAFVGATAAGYRDVLADPDQALDDLLEANPALDRELAQAQLDAYEPLFQAQAPRYGVIEPDAVAALSDFLVENGLASEPIPFARFATNAFVPPAGEASKRQAQTGSG